MPPKCVSLRREFGNWPWSSFGHLMVPSPHGERVRVRVPSIG